MPSRLNRNGNGVAADVDEARREAIPEGWYEKWMHWPVNWSAVMVGALAAVAAVIVFGLCSVALGAHLLDPTQRVVDLKKVGFLTLACSVAGAFFAFVIGGWVSGKIAGILRSEPGMVHGAIVWLVTIPILLILAGVGAGSAMGGWLGGMSSSPTASAAPYERPDLLSANATEEERAQYRAEQAEYKQKVRQWQNETPKVARNTALGAVSALLLGLIGSILGGWMASGEPMTFTHHRNRRETADSRTERVPTRA